MTVKMKLFMTVCLVRLMQLKHMQSQFEQGGGERTTMPICIYAINEPTFQFQKQTIEDVGKFDVGVIHFMQK